MVTLTAHLYTLCVCVLFPRSHGECVSIMPLFGKSHKTPADIVKTLKENMAILVKQDKKTDKVEERRGEEDSVCKCVCECLGPEGDSRL